jgi:hypothetical protein
MLTRYNFLLLSLLFLIPGAIIFVFRRDLRRVIGLMSICSLPFAFTESLFYPEYWEPVFLFDLADRIGFGVEDLLFVVGLGAFTSTAYAFVFRRRYQQIGPIEPRSIALRGALVLGVTFVLVAAAALIGVAMIFGSFGIMLGVTGVICLIRRDLLLPSLLGGVSSLVVYTALCLAFGWLLPGVFDLSWHTERFLDIFWLGIPLEELMYGFASGVAATAFYPYVTNQRFVVASEAHRDVT